MLAQPSVVDVVAKEKGDREWKLVVEVEPGEWSLPRAVHLLEEKLNAYASFALDGQMTRLYPQALARNVHIVIASVDPLPEAAVRLLEKVRIGMRPHDMRLTWDEAGGATLPTPGGAPKAQA